MTRTSTAAPLRFLALGDSYTIGQGVDPAHRWPEQLAARLRETGVEVGRPHVVAVTGWTTAELAAGIDAADLDGPFDLVTLLIGVNDQYDEVPEADYRTEVGALLDRAVAFVDGEPGRVVAISFPDWGVTPFGAADSRGPARIAQQVDAFNAVAREEARARVIAWVDLADASRQWGDRVVDDGLHPDATAYAAWTDLILPDARAALTR